MTDENMNEMPDLDELDPEEREAAEQAIGEIQTDAKVNFALADWLSGGTPKKGNVVVYRDLNAVADYAAGQKKLELVEAELIELSKDENATDEQINAARSAHQEAEEALDELRKPMLEGALNIVFRPIPGEIDDKIRAKARKMFYPGGQPRDGDAGPQSAEWIERTSLGHGIKEMKTAHGSIPIQNRNRIGHDLQSMLDFTQFRRLLTTWQIYRFGDAVADAAISDPGF